MRARWVSPRPKPELPIVGQAIVATWWPGRYHFVSTIQLDPTDPLRRLTEKISGHQQTEAFVTNVYRCNKDGWWGDNSPLYERTYETLEEAKGGHEQALRLVSQGNLKMWMKLNEGELQRWLHLRAIEWTNWPAFLSQLVLPILVIFYRWPYVLAGVVVVDILWATIRYSFVSPNLSNTGCLLVGWLKWPVSIGSAAYLFLISHSYGVGILALAWPLLAGLVCVPGQVGRVELELAKRVGYVDKAVELGA
jgi:hypothetical protein